MLARIAALALLTCCIAGEDPVDEGDDGDGEEDAGVTSAAVNPAALAIGFNDGSPDQFGYYADFYAHDVHPGARLCHAYVQWNVANQAPHSGDASDHASRAFVDAWFAAAEGHCDEALISFKSMTHASPPSTSAYADAFEKFAATNWAAETGFTGKLAFTPWNEPNNAADAGTGLGVAIDARLAARYFLVAERSCRAHGCTVAAGDFASNGNMWNDFEWNCSNDNVAPADLCKTKSSANPAHAPASYLDRYKNEIVNRAHELGLPAGFRPKFFAFHGWHDTNRYIDAGDHCASYETCGLRRILRSLGGSWGGVVLWDTEDGVGQTSSPDDAHQACAAAFLIRLQTINPRIHRLYLTRLHGGGGQLLVGHAARPALVVFAQRERTFSGASCD